ncbi:MAG TPA: FliM/FliN family flagellar motor switch protein [Gemmataceae bacterium]|nr:FliM/FliN family flagellar motor switch protein [Gemmataceae bacterium]
MHNFAKPNRLAGDLELRLTAWLKVVSALAPRKWAKVLPFELDMGAGPLTRVVPEEALEQLPETVVAYRIALPPETATLAIFPRITMLTVVAGLLGDGAGGLTQDRELTGVEESLFRYFLQDFLLPVFQEAWPGTTPLVPTLDRLEVNPRWSRIFADVGHLLSCGFVMRCGGVKHNCQWLAPQKGLLALLGETVQQHGETATGPAPPSPNIETLVRELPVEIAVQLGSAELSLSQLARLDVGDMVILNQKVTEPLLASVGGGHKFRGWAGRIGALQAFQIESLTPTH